MWRGTSYDRDFLLTGKKLSRRVSIPDVAGNLVRQAEESKGVCKIFKSFNPRCGGEPRTTRKKRIFYDYDAEFQSPMWRGTSYDYTFDFLIEEALDRFQSPMWRGTSYDSLKAKGLLSLMLCFNPRCGGEPRTTR